MIPTMLRVLMTWLAEKLTSGDRLQRPVRLLRGLPPLSFYTDAKAESTRAWIGGFLELGEGKPGSKRARPPALAKSQARAGPGARAELRADHRLGRGPANDLS